MAGKADAQFAIDIASRMSGGEHTAAELDALTAQLMGAGRGADFFQQAIKKLSGDLSAAKAASEAANAALSAGQAEYRVLETAALQAAKAAEKAAAKGGDNADEVSALAAKALQAKGAVDEYSTTLKKLEGESEAAAAGEAELAQQLDNVKKLSGHVDKSLGAQAENLEKFGGALGAVGGPLGQLGQNLVRPAQGFAKLSANIGTARAAMLLGAVGAVALAAAVAALAAAAVAATVKVAAWSVGLADSARNAELAREAVAAMHPEIGALGGEFKALKKETGLGDAELVSITKQLRAAKVSAEDLPDALRAAALAEKALGSGGASEFVEQIRKGEESVSDLAAATQSKLGGIVARQMLSIEAQSARAKSGFNAMFSGLNIDPVLEGMRILADLFDENSEAAKTVKFLFETILQPIIDQATNAAYVVEAFYLGFLIGATKLFILLKPVFRAVADLFGFEDTTLADLLTAATSAGEIFAYIVAGLAAGFALLVGAVVAVSAVMAGFVAALIAIPVVIGEVAGSIVNSLIGAFTAAVEFIRGIDFLAIGTQIMQGLANGIIGGAGAVLNAITGAVKGAIGAAKSLLGIASPSKVFADIGALTGEGFTQGVEAENDNAHEALATMADPNAALAATSSPLAATAAPPASGGGEAADSGGGGGAVYDFTNAQITFQGVKDAPSGIAQFREMLVAVTKGESLAVGGKAA